MLTVGLLLSILFGVASAFNSTGLQENHESYHNNAQSPLLTFPVPDDRIRVPILLGVMSRCPDALLCESVFNSVLEVTWDIVDVDLTFVGTINPSDKTYGVTCKHGPGECAGNVQELCAIHHAATQQDWWHFLHCLNYEGRESVGNEALAERCAGVVSIPWDNKEFNGTVKQGIKGCIEGQEGKNLLKKSVKRTKALGIEKSCTIMISGKQRCVHDGDWKDCETGHTPEEITKYILDEYERLQHMNGTADLSTQ